MTGTYSNDWTPINSSIRTHSQQMRSFPLQKSGFGLARILSLLYILNY
ncbi:hypothetical protein CY0110_18942 [Crocosphaera chwakensis CCY0110]|uniref:Uncharacterized protein n=1 Tax=Crocosphaera chwakensis CCY0110 TaxID=391612 RepID=A3IJC0_9CHRO|nr:hypothetical protein CY0110_18942 [Crocosphaera chwakensis CCY0110]